MNPLANAVKQIQQAATAELSGDAQKSLTLADFLPRGYEGRAHFTNWTLDRAVRDGYTVQPTLYACVDRIVKGVTSVNWYTAQANTVDETDHEERIPNHPLTHLIYNPNEWMSKNRMFQYLVQHMYLGGNALWAKVPVNVNGRRVIGELWPIPPDKIKPVPGNNNFIEYYEVDKSIVPAGRIEYTDIIHNQFASPNDPYWGIAPLMALAMTIDTDVEAIRWNMFSLQNRARVSGVLAFDQGLTEDQYKAARKKIQEQRQGASNAHGVMIMPHGVTFTPWTMTNEELDFINSRKFNREDVTAVHGLMPPAIGYMENATLANLEIADRAVWHNAVIPFLELVREELNRSLVPEFGPGITLEYDLSHIPVLQEDFDSKVQTAARLFQMGVPFNKINHRLNLGIDDIPGGDNSYLPVNLIPAGSDPHPLVANNNDEAERAIRELLDSKQRKIHAIPAHVGQREYKVPETEEEKEFYWKQFEGRREVWYDRVESLVLELMKDEGKLIARAFERNGTEEAALAAIDENVEEWATLFKAVYQAIIEDFGELTYNNLRRDFNPYDDFIQDWIARWSLERATLISETSKTDARRVIARGFEENLTIPQIAQLLEEYYVEDAVYRAHRTARTEVVGVSNAGNHFAALQSNVMVSRMWVSSRDDRVRDDHAHADGQTVGSTEAYTVGGHRAMFPGDPSLPAEQIIHCRCVEAFGV